MASKETVADDTMTAQPQQTEDKQMDKHATLTGAAFMTSVAGMSMIFGFGATLAMAKKSDPTLFNKGLVGSRKIPESGAALAMRALGWGTLYACTGVGILCFGAWKLLGVHNMQEFTTKVQSKLPRISKPDSQGRKDFESVRELIGYILTEDEKTKAGKSR